MDWRSVGDRPVKVEKEAALFRQKKKFPALSERGELTDLDVAWRLQFLFSASVWEVISSCFAKARPSYGSFFLLDKREQSTYNECGSGILLTGVYLSPK